MSQKKEASPWEEFEMPLSLGSVLINVAQGVENNARGARFGSDVRAFGKLGFIDTEKNIVAPAENALDGIGATELAKVRTEQVAFLEGYVAPLGVVVHEHRRSIAALFKRLRKIDKWQHIAVPHEARFQNSCIGYILGAQPVCHNLIQKNQNAGIFRNEFYEIRLGHMQHGAVFQGDHRIADGFVGNEAHFTKAGTFFQNCDFGVLTLVNFATDLGAARLQHIKKGSLGISLENYLTLFVFLDMGFENEKISSFAGDL